jgi:plasmid maintenance system antidote protein VapI
MTPIQYRAVLARLDLTQVDAAKLVGAHPRTVRHWITGDRAIPECVAILLRLLLAGDITIEQIDRARKVK